MLDLIIKFRVDYIMALIKVIIGILLINKTLSREIKKNIIVIYYMIIISCTVCCMFEFSLNNVFIGIIVGGLVGVILIKEKLNEAVVRSVFVFIVIYEIIEFVLYDYRINFSEIFNIYYYIDIDYLSIYIKFIASIFISAIICIFMARFIFKKKLNEYVTWIIGIFL